MLHSVEHGWYGVENLSLIPGEVGASAVQNIGTYGVEVKDLIARVGAIDICGKGKAYPVNECQYAYRQSLFKQPGMKSVFITCVVFTLSKEPCYKLDYGTVRTELARYGTIDLPTVRRAIIGIRCSKLPDPQIQGNAGSFFMNPVIPRQQFEFLQQQYPFMPGYEVNAHEEKVPAGWLIEQCGWKGKSLGRVAVHDKQALVLVNRGGANGKDVAALAEAVRARFHIDIRSEVNFV